MGKAVTGLRISLGIVRRVLIAVRSQSQPNRQSYVPLFTFSLPLSTLPLLRITNTTCESKIKSYAVERRNKLFLFRILPCPGTKELISYTRCAWPRPWLWK